MAGTGVSQHHTPMARQTAAFEMYIDCICFKQTELRKAVHLQFSESAQCGRKARIQVILQRQAQAAY
jgi:hypothetical protein